MEPLSGTHTFSRTLTVSREYSDSRRQIHHPRQECQAALQRCSSIKTSHPFKNAESISVLPFCSKWLKERPVPAICNETYLTQQRQKRAIRAKQFKDCITSNILDCQVWPSAIISNWRYNYTYLDQLHISPVNSTHRVLQKVPLHHRSILSTSTRKKHFKVPISLLS